MLMCTEDVLDGDWYQYWPHWIPAENKGTGLVLN